MTEKIRILFLSANPWTTSRILVDEEAREIFERLQEGPYRDKFELHKHAAIRPIDLQRFLMTYRPQIVHFSGHGSKKQKIILGGTHGRGKEVELQGLVDVFGLYQHHVRLVLLNACFTRTQARSLADVIDYSVGTGKGIGDKGGVAFAGAFYRALGFGKSVREAFESAKAELCLTKMPRTKGIELFVRSGISEENRFPTVDPHPGGFASDSWGCVSAPSLTRPNDYNSLQPGLTSPAEFPGFTTSDAGPFGHVIRYEAESYSQLAQAQVSLVPTKSATPASTFAKLGDKQSRSPLTTLPAARATRAKAAQPRPGKNKIEPRSLATNSLDYVTVTTKVRRDVLMVATRSVQKARARSSRTLETHHPQPRRACKCSCST